MTRSVPQNRLSLISRHIDPRSQPELNTPYSTERRSVLNDLEKKENDYTHKPKHETPQKMSNQAPHPALLIPGPIEFDDQVLQAMSHYR